MLAKEAFRSAQDRSHVTSSLAGFGLWDLIEVEPESAISQLDANDVEVADRTEWTLVKGGDGVLPAWQASQLAARKRLIDVVARHGDKAALPLHQQVKQDNPRGNDHSEWAERKMHALKLGVERFNHEQE